MTSYIKYRIKTYKQQLQRIDNIYQEILTVLQAQTNRDIKYIGANQLRDLLIKETNLKYKLMLWKTICAKVEANSNVNNRLIEEHGEIIKVWQWVGFHD